MSELEDRMRDALQGAAETVSPEAAQDLGERIRQRTGSAQRKAGPRRRLIAPIAAAMAVTGLAILAAVLAHQVPGSHRAHNGANPTATQTPDLRADRNGLGRASAVAPEFMIDESGSSPQVRSAATGAVVAQIQVPGQASSTGRRIISALATADGRTYVVAVYRSSPCQTWLYQFTLNSKGYPTALIPLPALPTIRGALVYGMSISGNGRVLAFTSVSSGPSCTARPQGPSHIGVTNVVTGQTRQWVVPRSDSVNNVSLTANGRLLLYSLQVSTSEVRAIPTSAQPGMASERGRTVVKAAEFGTSTWISFAEISPDGRTVYFSTFPSGGGGPGQIRVTDLTGRRPRVLAGGAYSPGLISPDPTVHHLRLYLHHKLSVLDLTTGEVTHLPTAWQFFVSQIIC